MWRCYKVSVVITNGGCLLFYLMELSTKRIIFLFAITLYFFIFKPILFENSHDKDKYNKLFLLDKSKLSTSALLVGKNIVNSRKTEN